MLPPFQTFLDEHRRDVLRFLVAMVGPVDADDCFQETFVSALRAYPRLEPGSNLRAWVLRIAQRKAIDHHRGTARRALPVAEVPEAAMQADVGIDVDGEPELWAQVRALPPKQRAAITYRYVSDLPYDEIAPLLDCSPDAARRSVHEGLKTLR